MAWTDDRFMQKLHMDQSARKKTRFHPRLSSSSVLCLCPEVGNGPNRGNVVIGDDFCISTSHNRDAGHANRGWSALKGVLGDIPFLLAQCSKYYLSSHSTKANVELSHAEQVWLETRGGLNGDRPLFLFVAMGWRTPKTDASLSRLLVLPP